MTGERENFLERRLAILAEDLLNITGEVGYSIHMDATYFNDGVGLDLWLHPRKGSGRPVHVGIISEIGGCIAKANKIKEENDGENISA